MKSIVFVLLLVSISLGPMSCNLKDAIDDLTVDISGKVTNDGSNVSGALILLVTGPNITDGMNLSNGSISNANGDYTILKVDAGEYYIVAVEDKDGNFQFDADTDRFGFHGVDLGELDLLPNKITVAKKDIENIDITYLTSL